MATTNATVGALAVQLARLTDEQKELRALVLDVLKEILKISSLQAEATNSFMRLVEAQQDIFKAQTQGQGMGRARDYSEDREYQDWRQELNSVAIRDTRDRPSAD